MDSTLGTAPLSNNWIILIIRLYMALNRTPVTGWGKYPNSTQVLHKTVEMGGPRDMCPDSFKGLGFRVKGCWTTLTSGGLELVE